MFDSETFISTFFEENVIQKAKRLLITSNFYAKKKNNCYRIITFFVRRKNDCLTANPDVTKVDAENLSKSFQINLSR